MGSSQKYWQYARDCARWANKTTQEDDREILERMAKAWVHVALADEALPGKFFMSPRAGFIPNRPYEKPQPERVWPGLKSITG